MATSAEAAPSDGSIPNSMNGWKFYQQSDSRWGGKVGSSTVSRGGCGPTSAAMMLSTIFGKEINPLTMTKWAHSNGTWTGAMQWTMPNKVASEFGLGIQDLGSNANGAPSSTLANVKAALKAGKPVMLTGRGTGASGSAARTDTPFTPGGHVVLAVGLDGNGNVIINDPRGAGRTKAYTDEGIMNVGVGLRGAWAFNPDGGKIPSSITTDGDFTGGGTNPGGTTPTDGSTGGTASTPAIDELGVFAKLGNIGKNYLASIYNGKEVDLFAQPVSTDTSTSPSDGGTTPGGDGSPWNGTKYDLSKYDMSGLSGNKQTHINKMIHPTLHTYKSHGLFPSLTFAQAAQESGWGLTSGLATKGNAAFGIKADKSWTGKVYTAKTREVYNGKSVTITDGFRAYDSLGDSIIDRANFLKANSRYTKAGVFSATSPEEQARAFQKAGYATDPNYASSLINLMNGSNLQRFDKPKPPVEDNAGSGDGNTYLVAPKENKHLTGDAGKGDGRVSYSRSIDGPPRNRVDAKAQRELEAINRKVNVAFNNINASDPNAYAEVLKIILQELQAINANTAATAEGVGGIEIASANAPVSGDNNQHPTTKERYQASKRNKQISKLQTINSSTGYSTARQIAGYKKTY
jgi:flagellum-specific peptidoglycan hydrolase FlgJ